jgi:hypothetical protein
MTDLNEAAQEFLSRDRQLRQIVKIRRDRPETRTTVEHETPQVLVAFFTMLRDNRERISYTLLHQICVQLDLASPRMQARSHGALTKRYVPEQFLHFVCRRCQPQDGSWYSDIAIDHFAWGWESEVDDVPPHNDIQIWHDFKQDLVFATDFMRAYDAVGSEEEVQDQEEDLGDEVVQTVWDRLWAWIRNRRK